MLMSPLCAPEARVVISAAQMWSGQSTEPWKSCLSGLNNSIYKALNLTIRWKTGFQKKRRRRTRTRNCVPANRTSERLKINLSWFAPTGKKNNSFQSCLTQSNLSYLKYYNHWWQTREFIISFHKQGFLRKCLWKGTWLSMLQYSTFCYVWRGWPICTSWVLGIPPCTR